MIFWLCMLFAACGLLLGCYWSLCNGIDDALLEALQEAHL